MLSRAKPAVGGDLPQADKRKKKGRKIPKLEELLSQRDFTGAITLLEFKRHVGEQEEDTNLWIGYCAFHLGDYKRALEEYENATKEENCNPEVWVNLACTYFFLGMYKQAEAAGFKAPKSRLQNRLLFHLAHKGIPCPQCVCGPVLLQVGLLRCVSRSPGCLPSANS
uniref:Intraflagellar transport protein 56 n=1 Tax=Equus caballus TaxID=9796 RepID=A0A9L0RGR0_HORSE